MLRKPDIVLNMPTGSLLPIMAVRGILFLLDGQKMATLQIGQILPRVLRNFKGQKIILLVSVKLEHILWSIGESLLLLATVRETQRPPLYFQGLAEGLGVLPRGV